MKLYRSVEARQDTAEGRWITMEGRINGLHIARYSRRKLVNVFSREVPSVDPHFCNHIRE